MQEVEVLPELKQIIGAMLFAAKHPISSNEIRKVLKQAAEVHGKETRDFAKAKDSQIKEAIAELQKDLEQAKLGFHVAEIANGYRLQNDSSCGRWLRILLEKGRPSRLSRPALETMAIIAYRQPCTRSEIEAVRGVAVDNIIRNLLEMQLIKAVGRSELPGRPWLFGTTQQFLEHFGLNDVNDLPGVDELRRMEEQTQKKKDEEGAEDADEEPTLVPDEQAVDTDADDDEDEDDEEEDEFDDEGDEEEDD